MKMIACQAVVCLAMAYDIGGAYASQNCPAALIKRVDPGEVWRGKHVMTVEPPDYPLEFILDDRAELSGGKHGLILTMKLCDGRTILEISRP